ncbi:MAG TPA: exo-alpha-sialidase [Aliidongia sp.]|uniref:sialidase family protein n=1 Tax=Aliidongia sp. TaxID=1914230 RepID=UPI002DDCC230|nr:exo-alpha-sialidase [Aliidongia sp.]HEV2677335.1 exo-alpha-sialidase [Aliidongia sp.]
MIATLAPTPAPSLLAQKDGILRPAEADPARLEAYLPSPCVQNHAANIMPLPGGDLACVWFGGTQEGIPDISVYFSRLAAGDERWSDAVRLSDDAARSEQNPILFPAPDGLLWLLWTAQVSGNQDTAIVRRRVSADNGRSWGEIETLFDTVGRSGVFVRQPPAVLDNGDILLPIFYCHGRPGEKWVGSYDTSAVRISADGGRTWREHEVPHSTGCVHMDVSQLVDSTLLALFRSRWADNIHSSRSNDRGRTWSAPIATDLRNNNSSIQSTRLANGHLALLFNDTNAEGVVERRASLYDDIEDDSGLKEPDAKPGERQAVWGVPRAPLTLALSEDGGRSWPRKRNLEVGDGYCMTNNSREQLNREYSYPSIKQGPDGALHIAFTYFRQAIKYVRVAEDWVGHGDDR